MGRMRGKRGPRICAATDYSDEYPDSAGRIWKPKKADARVESKSVGASTKSQTKFGSSPRESRAATANTSGLQVRACPNEANDCASAGETLLSLIKHPPASSEEKDIIQDVADTSDHASVSTDAVEGCSWWGDSTVYNTDVDQPSVEGEETVQGPDGELYAVFYPPDFVRELDPECDQKADSNITACGEEQYNQQAAQHQPITRQVCAEDGLANIVDFMSWSATRTYPSRVKLFNMVQDAAMEALGKHFQRFILVGSTALRIDTPDSDLDAVVFTRKSEEAGAPIVPARALRLVADMLCARHEDIHVQLVDCTRVPVLTVFMQETSLSLDLTVDEEQGESHVLWFQSLQAEASQPPESVCQVPNPSECGWSQGLQAVTLRCVKWWLRRRKIPLPREGGFPSITWTLMVLHALRCSVVVDNIEERGDRYRVLLCALAAFFDRFSEGGVAGSLFFTVCSGAGFVPHAPSLANEGMPRGLPLANLSVLDPTTTNETCAASGVLPTELAPQTSIATQMLYAYELRRAQALSAVALMQTGQEESCDASACALQEMFADVDDSMNVMPASMPADLTGVIVLRANTLQFGILHCIHAKSGWSAPFLHRRDIRSSFALLPCSIDMESGALTPFACGCPEWFRPCDFVCMAPLHCQTAGDLKLDAESFLRWREMSSLVQVECAFESSCGHPEPEAPSAPTNTSNSRRKQRHKRRHNNQNYNRYGRVIERI